MLRTGLFIDKSTLDDESSPLADECRAVLKQGSPPKANPRHCRQTSFDIFVLGGRLMSSQTRVKSVNRVVAPRLIKSVAPMTSRRSGSQTVLVKGEVFVIGGAGTDVKHNFVEKHSPFAGRWEKVAGMPDAREDHCAFMRKICIFGGSCKAGKFRSTSSCLELQARQRHGRPAASSAAGSW